MTALWDVTFYRFSGKEVHPNSGSVSYLYRCYDPITCRWLTRDPLQENGGRYNLYEFVRNSPLNNFDFAGPLAGTIRFEKVSTVWGACVYAKKPGSNASTGGEPNGASKHWH